MSKICLHEYQSIDLHIIKILSNLKSAYSDHLASVKEERRIEKTVHVIDQRMSQENASELKS